MHCIIKTHKQKPWDGGEAPSVDKRSSLTCLIHEGGPLMEIKPFAMLFVMAEIVIENWMSTKLIM